MSLDSEALSGVTVGNVGAAAMNAAALVVGQYYMSQIDDKLEGITSEIEKVADFQDNEYKGKVFALMAQVQKIANFQSEILMNEELRKNEVSNINSLERTCSELLGQANIAVKGFSQNTKFDYKGYEKEIENARNWCVYQKTLYEILTQLGELKYTLYLGQMSREQCVSMLCLYAKQAEEALLELQGWHQTQIERFKINIEESVRKRAGFDAVVHFIPGLIDEKHNYRSVPERVLSEIQVQTEAYAIAEHSSAPELYQEDVNIIAKDGKVYFLLPESNATV